MDPIKEAFSRAKQDIYQIQEQISSLQVEIKFMKELLTSIQLAQSSSSIYTDRQTIQQTDIKENQTFQHTIPTDKLNEPQNISYKALKSQNLQFSTRNEGVPTDRQTNQQTDRQTTNLDKSPSLNLLNSQISLNSVSKVLESFNYLRDDLKKKFSNLTKQEILVFATIYQLEEEKFVVDYPILAKKLGLTESSIRDYTLKIIKKGLPLEKQKQKNKKVFLSISSELKKIVSLQTILSLKEL